MPQKACERCFCHVMVFAFLFEMSQNRRIGSFSILKLITFSESNRKNGAFQLKIT